jgi:hypothetical protein
LDSVLPIRSLQEQFKRWLFEINSRVEPANAKFAEFLGQFSKEQTVCVALELAPAESGCFRLWALLFVQEALTGEDLPERSEQDVALSALLEQLT